MVFDFPVEECMATCWNLHDSFATFSTPKIYEKKMVYLHLNDVWVHIKHLRQNIYSFRVLAHYLLGIEYMTNQYKINKKKPKIPKIFIIIVHMYSIAL